MNAIPETPYGGDVRHKVTIIADDGRSTVSKDITPLVLEFNIYQSIFENTMSCDISLVDATGAIFEEIEVSGQELVNIYLRNASGGASYTFRLYKVSSPHPLQERSYALNLHGVSAALESSLNKPVFNFYKGKTGDEIVKEIVGEYISPRAKLNAEKGKNLLTYTGAGHTPFEMINMVARDTQSAKFPDASAYLFFENVYGYNFVSVNSLLQQNPQEEFYFADPGTSSSNNDRKYISGITWHHTVDTLKGLQNGLYDNTVSSIDPITKTYKEYTFNYAKENSKLTSIRGGGKPLIRPKAFGGNHLGDALTGSSHVRLIETDFNIDIDNQTIDGRITEDNDPHKFHAKNTHNFLPAKIAQMASLQQHRIDVTTKFAASVTAGDVIKLFLPRNVGDDASRFEPYFNMYGQRNPTFLVLENIITYEGINGNIFSTLKLTKQSLGHQLFGAPTSLADLLSSLFGALPQNLLGTPNTSGENTAQNQQQTLEEAAASVDGQVLTDEDGNKGLSFSTLTPLEKQYALEQGYADADTYPDGTFE